MKKTLFIPLVTVLLSIAAIQATSKVHPDGYHFFHVIHLDDAAIMTKSHLVIQPLLLAKDHDYDLVLNNITSDVLITIKDDRGVVVASNFDKKTNTYYKSLVFQSHISEFYHIMLKSDKIQNKGVCRIYSKCHLDKKDNCKE